MRTDKNQAIKLRRQGKSYTQITQILGIPKSTLSGWLNNFVLSEKAKSKIAERLREGSYRGLLKKSQQQTEQARKRAHEIRVLAKKDLVHLTQRDLFLLGVGLYWGEGYKRPIIKNGKARTYHPVKLTNSDPYLVKMFLRFLREICKVSEDKIVVRVRIYKHQSQSQLLEFWSKITNIDKQKFRKFSYPISRSSLGKRPFNILPYGTIEVNVSSTALYHKIMGWIEALK